MTQTAGDKRFAAVRKTLDNLRLERTPTERKFHDAFLYACMPAILGDEWEAVGAAMKDKNEWQDNKLYPVCVAPKFNGKTTAIAMFAAALLLSCPNLTVRILSTGKRASDAMTNKVKDLICNTNGGVDRIKQLTGHSFRVQSTDGAPDSDLQCVAVSDTTIRGPKPHVLFVDDHEFGHEQYTQLVVPVMAVRDTAVIAVGRNEQDTDVHIAYPDL